MNPNLLTRVRLAEARASRTATSIVDEVAFTADLSPTTVVDLIGSAPVELLQERVLDVIPEVPPRPRKVGQRTPPWTDLKVKDEATLAAIREAFRNRPRKVRVKEWVAGEAARRGVSASTIRRIVYGFGTPEYIVSKRKETLK